MPIKAATPNRNGWRLRGSRRRASSLDDGFVRQIPVASVPVEDALARQFRHRPLGTAVRA
jgi:hypothetical protein